MATPRPLRVGPSARSWIRDLGLATLDFLAPARCTACDTAILTTGPLCPACELGLAAIRLDCAECAAAKPRGASRCPVCTLVDAPVLRLALGRYDAPIRDLVLRAKWNRDRLARALLTKSLVERFESALRRSAFDAVIPVPRDRWRSIRHGPSLAEELAADLEPRLLLDALPPPRRRRRAPQASLDGDRRRTNLRGSFWGPDRIARRWRGRRVLIVDDVITTGSTITEMRRCLERAGVRSVGVLVVAVRD